MTIGLWHVLAVPNDGQDVAYIVDVYRSRTQAVERRMELELRDRQTRFVLLMIVVEDSTRDLAPLEVLHRE